MSNEVHTDKIQKVTPPAYLLKRLETFQIGKGGKVSYLLRDKVLGKNYDFEPWQFFVLEVLPGCDTFNKIASVFEDRFGRQIKRKELEEFFASVADSNLFNEDAAKHPLLAPFCQKSYAVEDGKAKVKSFQSVSTEGNAAWESKTEDKAKPGVAKKEAELKDLPAGVQDVLGLDPKKTKKMWTLFDPRPLLKLLVPVLSPLKYSVYLLPLLAAAALFVIVDHAREVRVDIDHLYSTVTLLTHIVFSMFTVNLIATLTTACVAYSYRATVSGIGIGVYMGFLPRFVARIGHVEQLQRREVMWLHASPLLARIGMFSLGILLWYHSRVADGFLPKASLGLSLVCFIDLLFASGNPMAKGSGYHVLSAFLNEPNLRGRAFSTLLNRLRGSSYKKADNDVLVAYALAVSVFMFVLIVFVLQLVSNGLGKMQIGGSAILLTVALGAYLLRGTVNRFKKIAEAYERSVQLNRWKDRAVPAETAAAAAATGKEETGGVGGYVRRAIPLMLLIVLFLPYHYQSGGNLTIYAFQQADITPDVPGIVAEVYFDGGEAVKKGTVIARLKDDDNQARVDYYTAKMKEQQSVIDNLKTLPKPEEIKVAQADLDVAITHEKFSREKVPRIEKLYKQGAVSFDEYDSVKKEHDVDVRQVAQKKAALELAKTGPTADEIAAAQAEWESLKEERDAYQDKVNRSVLTMPFDGNILTLHLKDKINTYLEKGKTFAKVEDTAQVTAEIDVPEADIGNAALGATIHAKPQAYSDQVFDGTVTTIDRNVTALPTGNVIKVIATIGNKDGKLKTGMSGYAKIDGPTMPVWKAFSLAIQRFFNIDVWSWIP
jgi:putative peptide zinc metalloprotease protein